MFEIIGFDKKVDKKGSQFMRFKFTNFINQNGLDELVEHSVYKYKGKNENFTRLGQRRYKNGKTKALLTKDIVTESPPRMKSIARFREEFAKKVGTLLKVVGNKELPSSFITSTSSRYLEEKEANEQKRRKLLLFELKSKLLHLFYSLLPGGVDQRARYLLELSVDSKKLRR